MSAEIKDKKVIDIRSSGLISGKVFGTLVRDHVELGVDPLSLVVHHLKGVAVVTVHESPSCLSAMCTRYGKHGKHGSAGFKIEIDIPLGIPRSPIRIMT